MPETNIQQWKSRPIFLSSTFRDMHAERDRLRQHVFPRLEEELLKRRHHLEWIDLRQGVESGAASTEEERELLVLKVCLDEIKRSRPFLIVLLGDRYGWVPPADRMDAATDEAGFSAEVHSRSVTALEIEYGILKETPDQQRRCFFYFREPLPYDEMPLEVSATYSEQFANDELAAVRWFALEELKKRLTEDDELKPRIRPYSAGWDPEKNTVTGLEAWGDRVFQDLWRELDEETREFAARLAPTWEESERDALAEFVEQRSRDFTGRDDLIGQLLDLAKSPAAAADAIVSWGASVTGSPGAGKSALFAKLVSELERDPKVLVLANAAGTSPRSASVDAMLRRWIGELAAFLGIADPLPENASVEEVDQTFASLLGRASVKQRVVVVVDALNQFEPTPRAIEMTWRPKLWPPNARLITTALPGSAADAFEQWAGVEEIELPLLTEGDAREIGHSVWRRYHCPWSDAVWRTLAAKRLADNGVAAVGNPLWTTLACEQLALLDADDFTRAERQFAEERDPQARLTQLRRDLAQRMPPDVPGLYAWLLAQTEKIHGEAWARAFAVAIALSRHGWRELDMRLLVPALAARLYPETPAAEITSLQLAALRRSFRAHLAVRGENQQWDFFHAQMREAIGRNLPSDLAEVRGLHAALADHLLSMPSDDPLRETETMFHLLEGDDYARASSYYGSALTVGEAQGATAVLAARVLAGEAKEPNAALALVESLLRHAEHTDLQITANLGNRFQFELNDAIENQARLPTRLALHELNLDFVERLAGANPSNAGWQRDLAVSHNKVGDVLLAQGDLGGAVAAYRATLQIAERLAGADPSNAGWQHDLAVSQHRVGDVLRTQGDLGGAVTAYRASLQIAERLAGADPSNAEWQHDLAVSHNNIGDVLLAQGDLGGAVAAYRASLQIPERLARADPSNAGWQHDLEVSHNRVGEVLLAQGDLVGAVAAYRASLQIAERLAEADPSNAGWQRDLGSAHCFVGIVLQEQGQLSEALRAYEAYRSIIERLAGADPSNAGWQHELSVGQDKVGDVLRAQGDLGGTLAAYRASLQIAERLAGADPSNTRWQRDLSVSHNKVGDVLLAQGDLVRAVAAYRASLQISERLAAADPSNAGWQRDLSVSHNSVGDVLRAQGNLGGAVAAHRASLQIRERLAGADPSNAGWQRDLSVSQEKVGDVLLAQGDLGGAVAAYRASLQISERLAGADPSNARWQRDLSVGHNKVGDVLLAQRDLVGAVAAYRAGLQIRERLAGADPSNAEWQRDLWASCWKIAVALEGSKDASCLDFYRRAHEILSSMKRRGLFVSRQDEQVLALLRDKLR